MYPKHKQTIINLQNKFAQVFLGFGTESNYYEDINDEAINQELAGQVFFQFNVN